jgi:hypothetical protein
MMKTIATSIGALFFLLVMQSLCPLLAQEGTFQMRIAMDLPKELNPDRIPACSVESDEEWIIDPAGASISKIVETFTIPCESNTTNLNPGEEVIRLRNISYEFSFLDLQEQMAKEMQLAFIALINKRVPIPEVYDPTEQLLSVYFHEEWTVDPGNQVFRKRVRGISPVIWQRRQTADGEPILDAETGLPVFYKHTLERIDLRNP